MGMCRRHRPRRRPAAWWLAGARRPRRPRGGRGRGYSVRKKRDAPLSRPRRTPKDAPTPSHAHPSAPHSVPVHLSTREKRAGSAGPSPRRASPSAPTSATPSDLLERHGGRRIGPVEPLENPQLEAGVRRDGHGGDEEGDAALVGLEIVVAWRERQGMGVLGLRMNEGRKKMGPIFFFRAPFFLSSSLPLPHPSAGESPPSTLPPSGTPGTRRWTR